MRNFRRIGAALVIGVMLMASTFMLTGCNNRGDEYGMLIRDGYLTVGLNPHFQPFNYMGGDGNVRGIEVDIARGIATELGLNVRFEIFPVFGSLIPAVQSRQIDVIMSTMTVREERLHHVNFSNPYFNAGMMVLARSGSNHAVMNATTRSGVIAAANVSGVRIGVQGGTTAEFFVRDHLPNATVVPFQNDALAIEALRAGTAVDFFVGDNVTVQGLDSDAAFQMVDVRLSYDQYGYAVRKGNYALLHRINMALAAMQSDGRMRAIFTEHGLMNGGIFFCPPPVA
ncbi:MAG: ABC transporter substrate-binding protein [Firmicutes bacterium]|nr:ABC transporter substrate-binding protein [Bacillota bacterium]